jgi:hypothetical protein
LVKFKQDYSYLHTLLESQGGFSSLPISRMYRNGRDTNKQGTTEGSAAAGRKYYFSLIDISRGVFYREYAQKTPVDLFGVIIFQNTCKNQ